MIEAEAEMKLSQRYRRYISIVLTERRKRDYELLDGSL
jgi:hypothetical protein